MINNNKVMKLSRVAYQSKYLDDNLVEAIERRYNQAHRYHHNLNHINNMIQMMVRDNIFSEELLLAILHHDIVCWPKKNDNEVESAELFREFSTHQRSNGKLQPTPEMINNITIAIIETSDHIPTTPLSTQLCYLDLAQMNSDFESVIEIEHNIFKEFQWVDWKIYQTERVNFLHKLLSNPFIQNTGNIEKLISYINNRIPKIGVYAGSFNPFHKGHLNILEKAENVFDKVIIARGSNPSKKNNVIIDDQFTEQFKPIEFKHRQIEVYDGLLTDFVKNLGYKVTLVRGLRNITDLQAELNQYRYLKDLMPELEMVSFYCDAEYEHISSSAIRDIDSYQSNITGKYRII